MALKPFLMVTGDFVKTGGMDRANFALASYLAGRGFETHLVTHRADPELAEHPGVVIHRVPKVADSYLLAAPLLDRVGRMWARRIAARGGRVIANGGSCIWGDINWVHYVHAAYRRQSGPGKLRRLKGTIAHRRARRGERRALAAARVIVANSNRTRDDLVLRLGVEPARVHTVYLGVDPATFHPATNSERTDTRAALGWDDARPIAAFVGAMGDRRKGFDTLFEAWRMLCSDQRWDVDLVVIGAGAGVRASQVRAERAGIAQRMCFLGYRNDLSTVLRACDLVVAPTRYDSYGLGVHEALCCGLPALVTANAGVAERYPTSLNHLLIPNPDDAADLAARLRRWRRDVEGYRRAVEPFASGLREYTWDDMAARIVELTEAAGHPPEATWQSARA